MSSITSHLQPKTWLIWLGFAWISGLTAGITLLAGTTTHSPLLAISTAALLPVLIIEIGRRKPETAQRFRGMIQPHHDEPKREH
jgi:ammonia channel protein AmtB